MDARELIAQYKEYPRRNRLLGMLGLGLVLPVYAYTNDLPPLEEQLGSMRNELSEAQRKYEKVEVERKNLPKIEEEFKFVQEQLVKAKASLPERLQIEDILQRTASLARETNVSLKDFSPSQEQEIKADYRYAEVPISLSLTGGFGNVMSYYDRLVHLASNVRLRGLNFSPQQLQGSAKTSSSQIDGKVMLVFFRSTDTGEVVAPKQEAPKPKFKPKQEGDAAGGASGE